MSRTEVCGTYIRMRDGPVRLRLEFILKNRAGDIEDRSGMRAFFLTVQTPANGPQSNATCTASNPHPGHSA